MVTIWRWNLAWWKLVIAIAGIIVTIVLAYLSIPQDFSIYVNPMEGRVQVQGVLQTTVTVIGSANGYKHPVSLSAIQQPSGVVVSFTPSIGGATPSYTSNVMITVGPNVPIGAHTIEMKGQGADGKTHIIYYTLYVMPPSPPTLTPTPTPTTTPVFEINITSPKDGDKVPGFSVVRGTIKGELPEGQYIWVVSDIDIVPGLWWPQAGPVKPQYGLWNANVWLGSNENVGRVFTIAAISMNENDNQIFVKYREEGNKTGDFPAIKLPDSATIMDSIKVTRIKDMNS